MREARLPRVIILASMAITLGCGGDAGAPRITAPPATASTMPTAPGFLSVAPGTATLATTQASFWAVKGQDREVAIWYRPDAGAEDSTRLVRFRVDKRSLCNRVDGTPIATGDSIHITLTVIDPARQVVQFAPAGLTFCSGRPAKLNMWYLETSDDLDHDGDVDASDAAIELTLRIWKQEGAGQPWTVIPSILEPDEDELEAEIGGFTNYVVAY